MEGMTITGIIGQKHSSQYIEKIDVLIRRSSSSAVTDLRIKTSYPFNEVNAVFLLNNPRYQNCIDCFNQNLPTIHEVAAVLLPINSSYVLGYIRTYVHGYVCTHKTNINNTKGTHQCTYVCRLRIHNFTERLLTPNAIYFVFDT